MHKKSERNYPPISAASFGETERQYVRRLPDIYDLHLTLIHDKYVISKKI